MYMLLLLAVLLTFLLGPAVASPIMDHTLPGGSIEPFYPDPEGMLNPLCELCAIPFYFCNQHAMPQAPYVAVSMLYNEPGTFHIPLSDHHETESDLAPIFAYVTDAHTQSLMDEHIDYMNANETKVQPNTVQAHIEDTYTPGDRLQQSRRPASRKPAHRRQAPRPGGYPCNVEGCERTFDRACELNRHQKTHLSRSERPHKCSTCNEGFLYPKDLARHRRRHIEQPSAQVTFFCQIPGCGNFEGFSRRDNLLRHQRKQHPIIAVA